MCIIVRLYLFLSFGHSVQLYCLSFFEWRLLNTILVFADCFYTMHRLKNIISCKNTSFNWARWSVSFIIFYTTQKGKHKQLFATNRRPIDEIQCRLNAWAHWSVLKEPHDHSGPMLIYVCYAQHVALMCKHWCCWKYQCNRYIPCFRIPLIICIISYWNLSYCTIFIK